MSKRLTINSSASSPESWDAADEECREEDDGGGEDDEEVDKRSSNVMIVYLFKYINTHTK